MASELLLTFQQQLLHALPALRSRHCDTAVVTAAAAAGREALLLAVLVEAGYDLSTSLFREPPARRRLRVGRQVT